MEDINYGFLEGWLPNPHAVVVLNEVLECTTESNLCFLIIRLYC